MGADNVLHGEVVKLDRKFPLVQFPDGRRLRCEHSADLKKRGKMRAVIGDVVEVQLPEGHDVGVICSIAPRRTKFVRKDPTERAVPQVLAANFDNVVIVQPAGELNLKRLERELVLAHETGARVHVVLTKADLADEAAPDAVASAQALAGADVPVLLMSADDGQSVANVRRLMPEGTTTVLIGRSGVGKSTLVNILAGSEMQATSAVRESDGKGRHTTVAREIIQLPVVVAEDGQREGGGRVVDMPGVRGLGLWDADDGMEAAFADVELLAQDCRFRDCKHDREPGCAVRAAVEDGRLSQKRLDSYLGLRQELAKTAKRRRQATWKNR